jgi:putative MATE family efflux protein
MPDEPPAERHRRPVGVPARPEQEILRLAVPAFLALVAEPVFLLADAAIVGHLGTAQLAGLGIAGAVVQTAVGLCVFLAYGTTASVARRLGAGDPRGALAQGVDGLWLAVLIGGATTVAGVLLAGPLVDLFDGAPAATGYATTYLRWAFLGVVPLLLMMASTGVLRGLQDTRVPLLVAVVGNLANVALNVLLVYGLGWGIAGSAVGTVLAQLCSAVALVGVVVRQARRTGAPLRPDLPGVRRAAHAGAALVVRTLTLRAALLLATYGSAALGVTATATHQVAMTLWNFLAFALDALAIAAQALTGRALGAGDVEGTRTLTALMVRWGAGAGVLGGVLLAAAAPFLGALFTPDPHVRRLLVPVLLVAALFQPVAGVVFVLDGVLIGAGDGRYLAWGGVAVLVVFAPLAWLAVAGPASLPWLWVAFGVGFIGARAVVLLLRARTDLWLVTGVR